MTLQAEEFKKKSFESELERLELAATAAANEQAEALRKEEERGFKQLLHEAGKKRAQKEATIKHAEEETFNKLQKEIQRRVDLRFQEQLTRKKAEEEVRRKADDERKQQEELRRQEEERKRAEEEARRKAEEDRKRAEAEAKKKAEEERKRQEELRKQEEERKRAEEEARRKAEEDRKRAEAEAKKKAEEERKRQEELRKQEEERKAQAELERKRKEQEAARLKLEEEARLRAEEERKQREEEQRKKDEAAKRQFEEEHARIEQESRKRIEEELRRKQEEQQQLEEKERIRREEQKQRESFLIQEARERDRVEREQRIITLIVNAKQFFDDGNLDNARAEIAKALINDPSNPTALELQSAIDQKIQATSEDLRKADNVKREKEEQPVQREVVQKTRFHVPVFLLIAVVTGALLVSVVLFFQLQKKVFSPTPSIAVLPWKSASGLPEDDVLGSSLAEEVAIHFEHSDLAHVLGFSSAYGFAKSSENPSRLASGLGYTFILTGAIERSGDSYKFDLSMRDTVGNTAWEKSYVKSLSNLSTFPGQAYADILEAMNISNPIPDGIAQQPVDPNSYFLYLRGKELMHRATRDSYESAYQLFQQAGEQDKNFALANAWKAMAVGVSTEQGIPIRSASVKDAMAMAENAVRQLPSSSDGFVALGILKSLDKKYKTALQLFDSAGVRSPNSSSIFLEKARVLIKVGEFDEALTELESAFKLSPRDPELLTLFGQTYQLVGNTADGIWYYETALYFTNDSTQYIAGPFSEAILQEPKLTLLYGDRVIASYRHNLAANSKDYVSLYRLARLYQLLGQTQESLTILKLGETILRDELRQNPQDATAMSHLAAVLTRLGKYPEALLYAQKALQRDSTDAGTKYRIAQVYSMQMYSRKTSSIDEELKQLCIVTLRDALVLSFRIDELLNADFYNMYEHTNFKEIIRQPL